MLLELADLLRGQVSVLHLFQYVTFRTIMSALTALAVALLLGPDAIRRLTAVKAGQVIRSDGPQSHFVKAGTQSKQLSRIKNEAIKVPISKSKRADNRKRKPSTRTGRSAI